MGDFVECKYCGSELHFVQQPPNSTHKWKALCKNCKNKKGEAKFNDWVSDAQIEEIVKMYPRSKVIAYDLMGKANVQHLKTAKTEKQRHEALVAKLADETKGIDMLSAEDEAIIKEILKKKKKS